MPFDLSFYRFNAFIYFVYKRNTLAEIREQPAEVGSSLPMWDSRD